MPETGEGLPSRDALQEINSEKLDDHHAAKIVFTSIRLAQGNEPLPGSLPGADSFEQRIFKYLHAAQPSWRIDDPTNVIELTTKRVMDMFHPGGPNQKGHYFRRIQNFFRPRNKADGKHHYPLKTTSPIHATISTERVVDQTKSDVAELYSILGYQPTPPKTPETQEQLTPLLVDHFLNEDSIFLLQRNGRQRANPDSNKFINDPYSSFTIHYVLRGRPTGVAELDEMCKTLREHILQQVAHPTSEWSGHNGPLLDKIIAAYNEHHSPKQQYMLPVPEALGEEKQVVSNEDLDSKNLENEESQIDL